jgi:GT2 family glycosyltransferase
METPSGEALDITIVLATHNRRDVVLHTLDQIERCDFPRNRYEMIAVDNASTDGTADAIAPIVDHVVRLRRNAGSCAKAWGADRARGRFLVFLDDDSFPTAGSLERMVERFADAPMLGAAGFSVTLPDGAQEGAALPGVFVGCGVGFRREAFDAVGGLDRTFFMQAEEYDLSFRLAQAGWKVEVLADLGVRHLKTARARRNQRTTFYDIRNNLRVIARYLPEPFHRIYREDCVQRYRWLAEREGHAMAFRRGWRAGRARSAIERFTFRGNRLSRVGVESLFRLAEIEKRLKSLAETGVRRIVLADLGKNVFPFVSGARAVGLDIPAIGDDRFAASDRQYRGIPIVPLEDALSQHCDAVVIANTGPVHAARTRRELQTRTQLPVYDWFGGEPPTEAGFCSPPPAATSDDIAARSLSLLGRGAGVRV